MTSKLNSKKPKRLLWNTITMIGLTIKEIKLKSGGSKINLKCHIKNTNN
jgi:hypothetical protein